MAEQLDACRSAVIRHFRSMLVTSPRGMSVENEQDEMRAAKYLSQLSTPRDALDMVCMFPCLEICCFLPQKCDRFLQCLTNKIMTSNLACDIIRLKKKEANIFFSSKILSMFPFSLSLFFFSSSPEYLKWFCHLLAMYSCVHVCMYMCSSVHQSKVRATGDSFQFITLPRPCFRLERGPDWIVLLARGGTLILFLFLI